MLIKQSELDDLINKLKSEGKTIVTTNGCFDILHVGHVRYLEKTKSFADVLIVALNSDKSVKSIKGDSRPINNENDRAEVLCELKSVMKPDVYTKGADYTVETLPEAKKIMEAGAKIEFISFVEGKSTTSIIEKMRK